MLGNLPKQRTMAWGALGIVLAGAFAAWALGAREGATVVTVKPSETYQVMTGWEVTARAWEMNKVANRFDGSWLDSRDEVIAVLADDAGINRIQIPIGSGAENPVDYWARFMKGEITYKEMWVHFYEKINDNADPKVANPAGFQFSYIDYQVENIVLPLQRRLAARGERLFISLCYVDFRWTNLSGDLSHARNPDEYAELIVETFRHLKTRWGVVPDTLEVVLEPENTEAWGGREIGKAAVAALARLHEDGLAPRLILPSTTDAQNVPRYFDEALRVPGVAEHLFSLSYHRYGSNTAKAFDAIRARAAAHGIPAEMLEKTGGTVGDLHEDLTVVGAAAWHQFSIGGLLERGRPGEPRVFLSDKGRYLAQYFKFIRMGATRIGAQSDRRGSKAVAFRNTNGTYVVVVNADRAGPVSVQGLPSGAYGARYTGGEGTPRDLAVTPSADGRGLSATLPAPGVITFHQTLPVKSH